MWPWTIFLDPQERLVGVGSHIHKFPASSLSWVTPDLFSPSLSLLILCPLPVLASCSESGLLPEQLPVCRLFPSFKAQLKCHLFFEVCDTLWHQASYLISLVSVFSPACRELLWGLNGPTCVRGLAHCRSLPQDCFLFSHGIPNSWLVTVHCSCLS